MKVLLDHCVPRGLSVALLSHEVQSARALGFDTLTNGKLIDAAEEADFEVLLTTDGGFEHQQNIAGREIGVLLVKTHPSTRRRLVAAATRIDSEIKVVQPGTIHVLTI